MVEQVIVHEELGRNTNGVWWAMPAATTCSGWARPTQIERYLEPTPARRARRRLRGHRGARPAPTRRHRGDRRAHRRRASGCEGEKWFVTSGDVADFYIVMVNVVDGDERAADAVPGRRATTPGIEIVDDPPFTHNYPHGHPTIRFDSRCRRTPCSAAPR